jgi:hypothetical protein
MDSPATAVVVILEPWSGHRRGAVVAVDRRHVAAMVARGVFELVLDIPPREIPATIPATASVAVEPVTTLPSAADAPRANRGRPPCR